MYTNEKIRIYPAGIQLLKVNNENSGTRCVICSKLTKKDPWNSLIDMKTLRNIDATLVSLLLTFKRFHTFSQFSFLNFGKCCQLGLPAEIKVQTGKNSFSVAFQKFGNFSFSLLTPTFSGGMTFKVDVKVFMYQGYLNYNISNLGFGDVIKRLSKI